MNVNLTNNPLTNNGLRIENSQIVSDTDSEIENDLPLHPKGFKNHWAAVMKAKDDDQLERVSLENLIRHVLIFLHIGLLINFCVGKQRKRREQIEADKIPPRP